MNTKRYYAQYDDAGKLISIGNGFGGVEITESEYNALFAEISVKASLVNQLYSGEITIDSVPADWQEEIQRRVNERIEREVEAAHQKVSGEEFMNMLKGVL